MSTTGRAADLKQVNDLIDQAGLVLSTGPEDPELFSNRTEAYLVALDAWRADLEQRYPGGLGEHPERDTLKDLCLKLSAVHEQVLVRANETRESVAEAMGSLRHRASSLKVYVDKLPQRITITGRREG